MYGKADGNARQARRFYQECFPGRRLPNVKVFIDTYQRLSETGSVQKRRAMGRNLDHIVEVEKAILEAFESDPTCSIRKIALQLNLSTWKVWSVLQTEGKYPFHYSPVQGLEDGDALRRTTFCRYLLNVDIEDGLFLESILWTDESKFTREGITNFHNLHFWADVGENPHKKRHSSFQRGKNLWGGIIGKTLIGPHILPDNLNGDNYLQFLEDVLPELLENIPLDVRRRLIFQNDGCPAHNRLTVREFLDRHYPARWFGRNGRN